MTDYVIKAKTLAIQLGMGIYKFVADHLAQVSAHALGWIAIVMLHFASFPTLWAVLTAQGDKLPSIDIMIFIWSALTTLFAKALLERDQLYIATIAVGFVAQTLLMGLILFK
jgi:hypothetical protein